MCGTQWTEKHTAVVCRFLGFSEFSVGESHRYNYICAMRRSRLLWVSWFYVALLSVDLMRR